MNSTLRERYEHADSALHRLDPRVKVVTTLILVIGIVTTPDRAWPAYPLLWALLAAMATLGQISPWRVARLAGLALPFALAAVTLLFTTPGQPAFSVLGLNVTDNGLARFAAIVLKSWLAVQAALLLSITTAFPDLIWALGSLRVPGTLVAIVSFMYRYLFTLRDEAERLMRARAARSVGTGPRAGGSLF
ncbi:MAG: cobalt ECF transporter T component CbiQ, partial [Anaerolineae bacterium]|nr:cobalt ECF transporter T component CbiQ [Anaerolineae bacterium]